MTARTFLDFIREKVPLHRGRPHIQCGRWVTLTAVPVRAGQGRWCCSAGLAGHDQQSARRFSS
jgi:hypothetical protein